MKRFENQASTDYRNKIEQAILELEAAMNNGQTHETYRMAYALVVANAGQEASSRRKKTI